MDESLVKAFRIDPPDEFSVNRTPRHALARHGGRAKPCEGSGRVVASEREPRLGGRGLSAGVQAAAAAGEV